MAIPDKPTDNSNGAADAARSAEDGSARGGALVRQETERLERFRKDTDERVQRDRERVNGTPAPNGGGL